MRWSGVSKMGMLGAKLAAWRIISIIFSLERELRYCFLCANVRLIPGTSGRPYLGTTAVGCCTFTSTVVGAEAIGFETAVTGGFAFFLP